MNYKKRLHDLEEFIRDRSRVYDNQTQDYKWATREVLILKNPEGNYKIAQQGATYSYRDARKWKCSPAHIAEVRRAGLIQLANLRAEYRARGLFPVKHFCSACRQVSLAPFLIGPYTAAPSCRNDDCKTQWWNKPAMRGDVFEAAKTIVAIDQASKEA